MLFIATNMLKFMKSQTGKNYYNMKVTHLVSTITIKMVSIGDVQNTIKTDALAKLLLIQTKPQV